MESSLYGSDNSLSGFSSDDGEGVTDGGYLDLDKNKMTSRPSSLAGFDDLDGSDGENDAAAAVITKAIPKKIKTKDSGYLDLDKAHADREAERKSMNLSDYEYYSDEDSSDDGGDGPNGAGYLQLGDDTPSQQKTPAPIVEAWEVFDAVTENDVEELEVLLELGANVNMKNSDGFTPLHQAAMLGHTDMIDTLLDGEADINLVTTTGQTALDLAVIAGKKKVVTILKKNGAKHSQGFIPPPPPAEVKRKNSFHGPDQPQIEVGRKCTVKGYMGTGLIRYVGKHKVKGTDVVGVELELQVGKNNGTVGGHKYFECKNKHGILCPAWKVTLSKKSERPLSAVSTYADDVPDRPVRGSSTESGLSDFRGFESPPASPGPTDAGRLRKESVYDGFGGALRSISVTEEDKRILLERTAGEGFGITVHEYNGNAFLAAIKPGGVAARNSKLIEGMKIESLNGQNMLGKGSAEVVAMLKKNMKVFFEVSDDPAGVLGLKKATLSKALSSNRDEFLRLHQMCRIFESRAKAPTYEPLPKGALKLKWEGESIYVVSKKKIAQVEHPGPKLKNLAKIPKGVKIPKVDNGIRCVLIPQPPDIPEGWVLFVRIDSKFEGSIFAEYYNTKSKELREDLPSKPKNGFLDYWVEGSYWDGKLLKHPFYMNTMTRQLTLSDPGSKIKKSSPGLAQLCYGHARTRRLDGDITNWRILEKKTTDYSQLDQNVVPKGMLPDDVWNKVLNRHLDIMPNPRTRVVCGADYETDVARYINANYVRGFNGDPEEYIVAMGPKSATVMNFWRMVIEHECPVIIMATKFIEKEKEKCYEYFPTELGEIKEFSGTRIQCLDVTKNTGFMRTLLGVTPMGQSTFEVTHFWYNTWPDHGVPKKKKKPFTTHVLRMLEQVEILRAQLQQERGTELGPSVVHCSAGVGRSGTIVAIDHARYFLRHYGKVSPVKIVQTIRQDRVALVQHANQFDFVVSACTAFSKLFGRKLLDSPKKEPTLPSLLDVHKTLEAEESAKAGKEAEA